MEAWTTERTQTTSPLCGGNTPHRNDEFETSVSLVNTARYSQQQDICVGGCQKPEIGELVFIVCHLNSYSELRPELLKTKYTHWQDPN